MRLKSGEFKVKLERLLKMNLNNIGYTEFFENQVEAKELVARVTKAYQKHYTILTEEGFEASSITGKLQFENEFPKVGDFVVYKKSDDKSHNSILRILNRKTCFSRKEAGSRSSEQILATNIDYAFIVMSLNDDFNLRRIERFLIGAWESGAEPIVILTKVDICSDLEEKLEKIEDVTMGVTVVAVCSLTGYGMQALEEYNIPGKTIALVGSSGVGKSTLINKLAGEEVMFTKGIREDDSMGRHTTTHREMILVKDGACLIDTPGMREFSAFSGEAGLDLEFKDIEDYSKQCKFSNCNHKDEPGCMIIQKLNSNELELSRYQSYLELKREIRHQERKRRNQEIVAAKKVEKLQRKSKPRQKKWSLND